ncbi:uracil nucleotide/cysteinyl leukotriene receptor-like [Engraulis encrasicolus]|uniref:uracil nucleotide/cysteinyl leukotriene receptor-like n=1 Tax=Engraulis encrasicolus TaxID=184585 RepID=UPI002FD59408
MTRFMRSNVTNSSTEEDFDFFCTKMPEAHILWAVLSIPSAFVGVPASAWLLWVLVKRQRSGVMTNDIYMLNLTVMDIVFTLCIIPAVINHFVWHDVIFKSVIDFPYTFNINGRPLFMACICVDCFMAVVYPVTYMKMKRSSYRWLPCAAVWVFTTLFLLALIYHQHLYFSSFVSVPYVISIPTIIVCDLAILRTLRKPDPSGRTDVHPQKQRALQTITNSFIMTLVCYLPVMVVNLFLSFMPATNLQKYCAISMPVVMTPLIGSIIMPLLHLHGLGKLRALQQCTRRVSGPPVQPTQQP